ncbi:MAG: methyltransferase domain-containing protein [Acidobacteriia bacterium]|nr:methyltransferase domain-containing protein [Terriglobia bacterium]
MTGPQPSGTASAEFHCWYAGDAGSARSKGRFTLGKFSRYLRPGPVVDLGCGEGGLLLALKEAGHADLTGVESNPELCTLAESFGVRVIRTDLQQYLAGGALSPATYFYLDVIEHVPFELNVRLFAALPQGSRLILQTPNTESLLGHQFYMNVPSHLAPYSPWVIRKMLERFGYSVVAEGSVEGDHPARWKNRFRAFFIRKVLGLAPELLLGGGNYYVIADRNRRTDEAQLG